MKLKDPLALDQIITQLMEQSNASRPVPATEDIISNLPREVLEADCERTTPTVQQNSTLTRVDSTHVTE